MSTDGTTDTGAPQRLNLYRDATEAAVSESREVQAEIASLEARVASLRKRKTVLDGLVQAMRALLPVPPERLAVYAPVEAISNPPSELRHRVASHRVVCEAATA